MQFHVRRRVPSRRRSNPGQIVRQRLRLLIPFCGRSDLRRHKSNVTRRQRRRNHRRRFFLSTCLLVSLSSYTIHQHRGHARHELTPPVIVEPCVLLFIRIPDGIVQMLTRFVLTSYLSLSLEGDNDDILQGNVIRAAGLTDAQPPRHARLRHSKDEVRANELFHVLWLLHVSTTCQQAHHTYRQYLLHYSLLTIHFFTAPRPPGSFCSSPTSH